MAATPEFYESALQVDTESLTIVVVAGADRAHVVEVLGIDLRRPQDDPYEDGVDFSGYAILEVPGGVVAHAPTGYADPSVDALVRLSQGGRRAAVVRAHIQAHDRFGCARDGKLMFDDDEYTYIEDPDRMPTELRPLFDLVWDDLADDNNDDERVDGTAVALAMAEVVTGLEVTAEHLRRLTESTYYRAPSLVYAQ